MFERLRRLIASPETKASRPGRVIALQGAGRPRWTPRDYAALACAAPWERVTRAPFVTVNKKRAATGYGAVEGGDAFAG